MYFRYKYKHLDCAYCADLESNLHCPHQHCQYILDNLDDLRHDRAFRKAVRHAEGCATNHKPALLLDYTWHVDKKQTNSFFMGLPSTGRRRTHSGVCCPGRSSPKWIR